MQRRHLLQSLAGTSLALSAGQLWAAGPAQPCFLVVFLRGGYDAANLLVPVGAGLCGVLIELWGPRPALAVFAAGLALRVIDPGRDRHLSATLVPGE